MQSFGTNYGGEKNWPRVGSSVFFRGRNGARLSESLLGIWHSRKRRASCINFPSQQFTLLSVCDLAPQLSEIHIIVENTPPFTMDWFSLRA